MGTSVGGSGDKNYLVRSSELLEAVGAVGPRRAKLMRRAAGIGWEQPLADNFEVSPEALERLSLPEVEATLFPSERRLRPKLWKALEWDDVPPAAEEIDIPIATLVDVSKIEQSGLSDRRTAIDALPRKLQELGRRVQLVCQDFDEAGVSPANVDQALTVDTLPYEELQQLPELRRALMDSHTKPAPVMIAVADLPLFGTQEFPMEHSGSIPVFLVSEVSVTEEASYRANPVSLERHRSLRQKLSYRIDVPEGEQVLILKSDRSSPQHDVVRGSGPQPGPVWGGLHRLERWKDGERLESSDIIFPNLPQESDVNIDAFLDYQLRHNGDPIPKLQTNSVDLTAMHQGGRQVANAQFEYRLDQYGPQIPIDPSFEPQYTLPLPPGRYREGHVIVDLFSSGAVRAQLQGGPSTPLLMEYGTMNAELEHPDLDRAVTIEFAEGGLLQVGSSSVGPEVNITLGEGHRVN